MSQRTIEDKLRKYLYENGGFKVDIIYKKESKYTIYLETENEITFDQLLELSKFFGTKKINLTSRSESSGGCETCSYTITITVVEIMEAIVPKEFL